MHRFALGTRARTDWSHRLAGEAPSDLTDDDIRVMYEVVDTVTEQADLASEPEAEDTARRHRLMTIGHDPLKP